MITGLIIASLDAGHSTVPAPAEEVLSFIAVNSMLLAFLLLRRIQSHFVAAKGILGVYQGKKRLTYRFAGANLSGSVSAAIRGGRTRRYPRYNPATVKLAK